MNYEEYVSQYIEDYKDSTGIKLTRKKAKEHFCKMTYKEAKEQERGWLK